MGYKDVVIMAGTIGRAGRTYNGITANMTGLTSDHVLLNDTLPAEITEDSTWTSSNGIMQIDFANGVVFSQPVELLLIAGIPDN